MRLNDLIRLLRKVARETGDDNPEVLVACVGENNCREPVGAVLKWAKDDPVEWNDAGSVTEWAETGGVVIVVR